MSNNRAISKQFALVDLTGGRRGIYNAASMNMVAGYNKKGTLFCRENSEYRDFLKKQGAVVHPEIGRLFSVRDILPEFIEEVRATNGRYWESKVKKALESAPVGVSKLFATRYVLPAQRWTIRKNGHDVCFSSVREDDKYALYASVLPDGDSFLDSSLLPQYGIEHRAVVQHGDKRYLYSRHSRSKLTAIVPYTGTMGMNYAIEDHIVSPMFYISGRWRFADDLSLEDINRAKSSHDIPFKALLLLERKGTKLRAALKHSGVNSKKG